MAIVNPTGSNTSALLKQIQADRARNVLGNPSAQPTAPIRQIVQGPELQAESPGSARVAAVKPLLADSAPASVPPLANTGVTPASTPAVPGAVVAAQADRPVVQTPGQPSAPVSPGSGPAAAPTAPPPAQAQGRPASRPTVLGINVASPSRSRITPRRIVDLPLSVRGGGFA